MAISNRGKQTWQIKVEAGTIPSTGKRLRRVETFHGSKRDAEKREAELRRQIESGEDLDPARMNLGEYLEKWLDSVRPGLAPQTVRKYEQCVSVHIRPRLGSVHLTKLRPLGVQAFYADLAAHGRAKGSGGLAPRSVYHVHRVLYEALQQAVKWQMIARNPCAAVEVSPGQRSEMSILTPVHARDLLVACDGDDSVYGDAIALAVHTGLRLGEILALKWANVDLESGSLAVRLSMERQKGVGLVERQPKTPRSRRTVPLGASGVALLRRTRTRYAEAKLRAGSEWQEGDRVFAGPFGRVIDDQTLRRWFYRSLEAAGLPRVRFHDLRHTHATLMLHWGANPKLVSERLGHAGVGITLDTYSHVLPTLQEEAARGFDAWLTADGRRMGANAQGS